MSADRIAPPLAHLGSARPPAPEWFQRALAHAPERTRHDVQGAQIEALSWGEVGKPGLLLLHGNGAHADWYGYIAPLLADDHRVVALSWSGMGGSDWRTAYSLDLYVAEAFGVAEATGLFESGTKPVFAGHSFGSFPLLACAARAGERLRGVVAIDMPLHTPEELKARAARQRDDGARRERFAGARPVRVYPSEAEALARFRFAPPQGCENLFIADHIARTSLRRARDEQGNEGWTWRFDPYLWRGYKMSNPAKDLAAARCPVALIRGARSKLVQDDAFAYAQSLAPRDAPAISIAGAEHHVMVDQPLQLSAALRRLIAHGGELAGVLHEVPPAAAAL